MFIISFSEMLFILRLRLEWLTADSHMGCQFRDVAVMVISSNVVGV